MLTLIPTVNYFSLFNNLLLVHLGSRFVCQFCSCIYAAGAILTTTILYIQISFAVESLFSPVGLGDCMPGLYKPPNNPDWICAERLPACIIYF